MNVKSKNIKTYNDVFHALCPYFAMFPPEFARNAIKKYSKPGDLVIDPFSGRGTTLLEARILGRWAIANDINPVAVTITKAKSLPLSLEKCLNEINRLKRGFSNANIDQLKKSASELPLFFKYAFHPDTLLQVLWLKDKLKNAKSAENIFIKTLCISHLHGETQKTKLVYFSNNLPHTYCPKPDYSIRFWKQRKMNAPSVDVFEVLADRCLFRLKDSVQHELSQKGYCIQGDARRFDKNLKKITKEKAQLVVTSPPYLKITSYEEDQWLRLWFLGHQPFPAQGIITKDDRIASQEKYVNFLAECWNAAGNVLKKDGIVVCRIGQSARDKFPLDLIMEESIKKSKHNFKMIEIKFSPFKSNRQAVMFGKGKCKESGEYDFIMKATH